MGWVSYNFWRFYQSWCYWLRQNLWRSYECEKTFCCFVRGNKEEWLLTCIDVSIYYFMQYLEDFNMSSSKEMKLVFFMDAIEHVSRCCDIIHNILITTLSCTQNCSDDTATPRQCSSCWCWWYWKAKPDKTSSSYMFLQVLSDWDNSWLQLRFFSWEFKGSLSDGWYWLPGHSVSVYWYPGMFFIFLNVESIFIMYIDCSWRVSWRYKQHA